MKRSHYNLEVAINTYYDSGLKGVTVENQNIPPSNAIPIKNIPAKNVPVRNIPSSVLSIKTESLKSVPVSNIIQVDRKELKKEISNVKNEIISIDIDSNTDVTYVADRDRNASTYANNVSKSKIEKKVPVNYTLSKPLVLAPPLSAPLSLPLPLHPSLPLNSGSQVETKPLPPLLPPSSSSSASSSLTTSLTTSATATAATAATTAAAAATTTAINSSSFSSSHESESYYLLGRRNVLGYTLCSGYLLRSQDVILELGGNQNDNNSGNNGKNSKNTDGNSNNDRDNLPLKVIKKNQNNNFNNSKSKDRFSGGKLMFRTVSYREKTSKIIHDSTRPISEFIEKLNKSKKPEKNINGRLPNILCDFLVPLLREKLIEIIGHISYDIGEVGIFVDVPINLHIIVSSKFLNLTGNDPILVKKKSNKNENNSLLREESYDDINIVEIKRMEEERKKAKDKENEIIEHANDLLLW